MPRPDYVRCETCVYCEVFEKDGDRSGSCRADRSMEGYFTELGSFCRHWRSTWPVEYREISMTYRGKECGNPERVEVPPPEVPQAKPVEAETELRPGLYYGGRGHGGETYWKEVDSLETDSLWVREGNELRWTPEDFDAIAADMRAREEANRP